MTKHQACELWITPAKPDPTSWLFNDVWLGKQGWIVVAGWRYKNTTSLSTLRHNYELVSIIHAHLSPTTLLSWIYSDKFIARTCLIQDTNEKIFEEKSNDLNRGFFDEKKVDLINWKIGTVDTTVSTFAK